MKPTFVAITVATLFIVLKMVLFFAGIQHTVLVKTTWMPLLILVLIGIFYVINQYIRSGEGYDWIAAFKKGFTVALFAGVITGIFIYVYYTAIDPEYLALRQVEMYNQIKVDVKPEELEKSTKSLKAAFKPTTFAIVTVSAVNVVGLIGSVIVGLLGKMTAGKVK